MTSILRTSLNKEERKERKKRGRGRGRPAGSCKPKTFMTNGVVTEEKLFLYVPEETIPKKARKRFVQLCDSMIISLGPETINDTDVEEVALYYRDRLYCDQMYKSFAEADGTTDSSMIAQLEKLNKSLEQRKQNLGSRFIDKGKPRKQATGQSIVDLFKDFQDNPQTFKNAGSAKVETINQNKPNFTTTADYMSQKTSSAPPKEEGSGE